MLEEDAYTEAKGRAVADQTPGESVVVTVFLNLRLIKSSLSLRNGC
jgi:hypothetical protein